MCTTIITFSTFSKGNMLEYENMLKFVKARCVRLQQVLHRGQTKRLFGFFRRTRDLAAPRARATEGKFGRELHQEDVRSGGQGDPPGLQIFDGLHILEVRVRVRVVVNKISQLDFPLGGDVGRPGVAEAHVQAFEVEVGTVVLAVEGCEKILERVVEEILFQFCRKIGKELPAFCERSVAPVPVHPVDDQLSPGRQVSPSFSFATENQVKVCNLEVCLRGQARKQSSKVGFRVPLLHIFCHGGGDSSPRYFGVDRRQKRTETQVLQCQILPPDPPTAFSVGPPHLEPATPEGILLLAQVTEGRPDARPGGCSGLCHDKI